MDTKNQFAYFLLSVGIGFVGGAIYELFAVIRRIFRCRKRKMIGHAVDISYCISFAIWCIFASFLLRFPDFRGYMFLGWGLGCAIYLKILHRIVAFLENMWYNVLVKMVTKAKSKEKTLQKERNDI